MLSFECRPCSLALSLDDDVEGLPLGGGDTTRDGSGGEDATAPSCGRLGKLTGSRGDVVPRTGELEANADTGDCVSCGIDDVREEIVPNALVV